MVGSVGREKTAVGAPGLTNWKEIWDGSVVEKAAGGNNK
ncbi:hypothetical protein T4B_449 [Trichinella pseudospiralis]|uniref:Uncharacterized protein n=1 Tax=Trichinella pseudospiralis TaxID=6337 RepID=A0A0V1GF88_TRIPS|nr:hypothetical protein T4B_449 [Trichinella pseudospiralis]